MVDRIISIAMLASFQLFAMAAARSGEAVLFIATVLMGAALTFRFLWLHKRVDLAAQSRRLEFEAMSRGQDEVIAAAAWKRTSG